MENYEKLKKIGKGSFGNVHLVQSKVDQKLYALKKVPISALGTPSPSPVNEIQLMRTLDHPNIIKYHDSFEHKGDLCIIMEYAEGGDLSQTIIEAQKKKIHFSEDQILCWFAQLCLALNYLHENKILHRDIKITNILLTQSNLVFFSLIIIFDKICFEKLKLGDFGISKKLESTTDFTKTAVGTPYYLPPEMLDRKHYEHYNFSIDVWMLGCVLYELCTLEKPFYDKDESWENFFQKIVFANPKSIPENYSPYLQKLINRMLNKVPGNRIKVSELLGIKEIQEKIEEIKQTNKMVSDYFLSQSPQLQSRNSLTAIIKKRKNSVMTLQKPHTLSSENSLLNSDGKEEESIRKQTFPQNTKIGTGNHFLGFPPPPPLKTRWSIQKIDFEETTNSQKPETQIFPKKTYQKAISINTSNLDSSHFLRKKQSKESVNSLDSVKNTSDSNTIPTDKFQSKKFSFMLDFDRKTPNATNRTILSSEFLKNKLGREKFIKMKEFIETSGNPLKSLEDKKKIIDIIGEDNLECIPIYKFLISNAVTPSNSNLGDGFGKIDSSEKFEEKKLCAENK